MASLRILVADPSPKFLDKARKALGAAGHEVTVAGTADEALKIASEKELDAVVASSQLPGGGFDLCRNVKVDCDPTIPCVLIVPDESSETRSAAAECGAENYLVKPVREKDLLCVMRDVATIRHLKRRLVEVRGANGRDVIFDPYTGFHTFAHFKEVLFIEVKRAKRYHYPISLLLCAYDPGSGLPEGLGSAATRRQLFGGLAVAVRKCMRDYDIPVSYSERDVMVLMPHTDRTGAAIVGQRIQEAISRSTFRLDGKTIRPAVSVGVAGSAPDHPVSFSELVREAKVALGSNEGTSSRSETTVEV